MTQPVTNSGRALPLPPKGINVNATILPGLAEGPQCPNVFAKYVAPRKNLPSADAIGAELTPSPTGGEVCHG